MITINKKSHETKDTASQRPNLEITTSRIHHILIAY